MSAIISACGRHRYRLERGPFGQAGLLDLAGDSADDFQGKVVAFFGVNPSTADASVDDQTVMKWTGFCKLWGASRFIVGNVSSYRATDVRELGRVAVSPVHRARNLEHIQAITRDADILVPCWGNRSKAPSAMSADFDTVMALLVSSGKPVMHLGLTQGGDPRHPLMLAYSTPLQHWSGQSARAG